MWLLVSLLLFGGLAVTYPQEALASHYYYLHTHQTKVRRNGIYTDTNGCRNSLLVWSRRSTKFRRGSEGRRSGRLVKCLQMLIGL